jgi:soluble lytic murein transglycosylase-like protein
VTSPTEWLQRATASTTASGVFLVGVPLGLDYVVRPGDTLSVIAERHHTSVSRIVARNDLAPSGHQVMAGQTLQIPAAHGPASANTASREGVSPDARRIVQYTVRPGDTATELAVRFHAWTAELISMNNLDSSSSLRVGQRIRIPVVLAAVRRDARDRAPRASQRQKAHPPRPTPRTAQPTRSSTGADPSRSTVRRIIERKAQQYGVDPQLALAVSWQEAGWQMHHVSHANAIGAMQVIPSTGQWMSRVIGRGLDLHDVHDNITAGVVLLRELNEVASQRGTIAGYYQGLAGVREHGMYEDTKRYVANVLALKKRFEAGDYPA